MQISRIYTAVGVLLLCAGVALYVQLAVTGRGSLLGSFFCCMSSLLFFNLPAVMARRRQRRERRAPTENSQD